MGIRTVEITEVSCQHKGCDKVVYVNYWADADKLGWAVPVDGHLQLCPEHLGVHEQTSFRVEIPDSLAKRASEGSDASVEEEASLHGLRFYEGQLLRTLVFSSEEELHVGKGGFRGGVGEIRVIMECGQMGNVPWALVTYKNGTTAKWNLARCDGVWL